MQIYKLDAPKHRQVKNLQIKTHTHDKVQHKTSLKKRAVAMQYLQASDCPLTCLSLLVDLSWAIFLHSQARRLNIRANPHIARNDTDNSKNFNSCQDSL